MFRLERCIVHYKWKVKRSSYRPGQTLSFPLGWGPQITKQLAYEGDNVVNPTHRPSLLFNKYYLYTFLLEAESNPGPWCCRNCHVNKKFPVTPSGIESTTFRITAKCLNQMRQRLPLYITKFLRYCKSKEVK